MKVVKDLTTNSNSTSVQNPLENITWDAYFFQLILYWLKQTTDF
jgi:hypothetical protein